MKALPFHFLGDGYAPPARRWVASGLIAAGEVTALVGPPFAGKSAVAARLAADVAAGKRFLGVPTEQSPVLYIAAERAGATARRVMAMRHAEGLDVALSSGPLALAEPAGIDAVLAARAEIEARLNTALGLVIIDTLAACAVGLDENSQRDAGRIAEGLQRIADTGPAVVVLHHTSKGGADVRGSSVLTGAFDRVLTISKRRDGHTLKVTSANDGEAGAEFSFRLEGVETDRDAETGELIETVVIRDGAAVALPKRPGKREDALPPDAQRALEALCELGGSRVGATAWRDLTIEKFGDRTPGAKRQAFSAARKLLKERVFISDADGFVSVRNCQETSELTNSDGGERVSCMGP